MVQSSLKNVGERLRQAREAAGLSTRTAAYRVQQVGYSMTHATLANYELGKTVPPLPILDVLAKIYERKRDWFFSTQQMLTGIRYRAIKAVRISDKRIFEGEAQGWFTAYAAVDEIICDPCDRRANFTIASTDKGPDVAAGIRKDYKLDDYPIPSIVRIAEDYGIRVIQITHPARIDGMAAMLGNTPVIAVNSTIANDRMRMNVAHELAHHLFTDCVKGASLDNNEIEKRAMECASHLIIPDEAIRIAFSMKSMVRLVQYKERYGISLSAMIFRAHQMKLLKDHEYQRLWTEFSRLGWRKEEPGYVQPDRPIRMEALFDAAVRQNKMTYAEIASLAGVEERVVRKRVVLATGGTSTEDENRKNTNSIRLSTYFHERSSSKEFDHD